MQIDQDKMQFHVESHTIFATQLEKRNDQMMNYFSICTIDNHGLDFIWNTWKNCSFCLFLRPNEYDFSLSTRTMHLKYTRHVRNNEQFSFHFFRSKAKNERKKKKVMECVRIAWTLFLLLK